jgi:hypothetical protein
MRVESLAMKNEVRFVLSMAILSINLFAQVNSATHRPYEINISREVAEKLLIHKVDPDACPHIAMAARVACTVVVGFDIDKNGNVLHPKVISGPAMFRKPVIDAVRKYKYRPYLLNGKAVEVETIVSVKIDQIRDCHAE